MSETSKPEGKTAQELRATFLRWMGTLNPGDMYEPHIERFLDKLLAQTRREALLEAAAIKCIRCAKGFMPEHDGIPDQWWHGDVKCEVGKIHELLAETER